MAGAVQTFKDAAVEKVRLEGEAAEQRRAVEEQRKTAEAERAATARQQQQVVEGLAQGLERGGQIIVISGLARSGNPVLTRCGWAAGEQLLHSSRPDCGASTQHRMIASGER
jgi:hypothetical protein